ncbi:hypothetical protein AA14337_3144 [Acetobacter malorum DSM 14337]|uniref:Uncharacterized protein n=1 Tax=Acetobacter malorum DSM 14337 TaxID=1307910 RepID=A0ABQ0PZW9_9PROT|nr:hypothetical protein [Acetobacter malorum]KXV05722.1 hypothetical protein AD930_11360 [Acetobacter malorum]GBQ85714.1 hypothetical protein AA14337_3144 [Acetobacter malorum DSM 14337]
MSQPLHLFANEIAKATPVHPTPAGYAFHFDTPADPRDETEVHLTFKNAAPSFQDDGLLWADLQAMSPEGASLAPSDIPSIRAIMAENGISFDGCFSASVHNPEHAVAQAAAFQAALRCIRAIQRNALPS